MLPADTCTKGGGNTVGIRHADRIKQSGARLCVGRTLNHIGCVAQIVTHAIGCTKRKGLSRKEFTLILNAKVQLVTVDMGFIVARDSVDITVGIAHRDTLVITSPQIGEIGSHGESFHHLVAGSEIGLMDATRAIVCLSGIG